MHCSAPGPYRKLQTMIERRLLDSRSLPLICTLILCVTAPRCYAQGPSPAAISAYNSYVRAVESRLAIQHRSRTDFLVVSAASPQSRRQLRHGGLIIEQLTPADGLALPDALLHRWRGTAFVPGATAADFTRLMQNYAAYPSVFAPQVTRADVIFHHDNQFRIRMRVRQHHVITVVLDATYDVTFGQLDPLHTYSISRSTQVAEIDSPGTPSEHALTPSQEHGFLWRQNTYWTCEQRDGGLYIQVESISLTRAIPYGLGWAVGPFAESVPRDSLEFTLRAVSRALEQQRHRQ